MNCLICSNQMKENQGKEYFYCGDHCDVRINNETNIIISYDIAINNYMLQGVKRLNFTKLYSEDDFDFLVKTNWIPIDWNLPSANNLINRLLKLKAFT